MTRRRGAEGRGTRTDVIVSRAICAARRTLPSDGSRGNTAGWLPRQSTDRGGKRVTADGRMFLPDGEHFLFMAGATFSGYKDVDAVFVGCADDSGSRRNSSCRRMRTRLTQSRGFLFFVLTEIRRAAGATFGCSESLTLKGEPVDLLSDDSLCPSSEEGCVCGFERWFAVGARRWARSGGILAERRWFDRSGKGLRSAGSSPEFMGMWRSRRMTWPWLRTTLICRA